MRSYVVLGLIAVTAFIVVVFAINLVLTIAS